ncbi:MAG: cell wall hydrolase [Lachnospiraceae bacterium]|nr:cell wall hydrolase [Lachnospiraceae bacterium]
MGHKIIRGFSALLATAIVMASAGSVCSADELEDKIAQMQNEEQQTQDMISNLEKQTKATKDSINLLQEQKKAAQSNVNELNEQSAELRNEIEGYTGKLDALDGEIEKAENEMSKVSAQIVSLNDELNDMRELLKEKQMLLGKRIKNVYEKGGSKGMIVSILEARSFTDMLTRYEYANAMMRYDKQKIAECMELEKELVAKIEEVEEKEAELDAYQDDLDDKYSELEDLTEEVQGKLDVTNSSISAEKGKLRDFDAKLVQLDKTMKSLESQTASAQAQLAKQVAERLSMRKEDTSGAYSASGSELEWLAATIQAEAGGESYTGKLAVGSVIMNRVKSSAFPNDIKSVITQNMQFASYRSGKVELIIANGPNSTCVSAAQEVLGGARVGDYLFFMTKYYADYYGIREYTMIGNHAFFYKWETGAKKTEDKPAEETQPAEETAPPDDPDPEEESHEEDEEDDDEDDDEESDDDEE